MDELKSLLSEHIDLDNKIEAMGAQMSQLQQQKAELRKDINEEIKNHEMIPVDGEINININGTIYTISTQAKRMDSLKTLQIIVL